LEGDFFRLEGDKKILEGDFFRWEGVGNIWEVDLTNRKDIMSYLLKNGTWMVHADLSVFAGQADGK